MKLKEFFVISFLMCSCNAYTKQANKFESQPKLLEYVFAPDTKAPTPPKKEGLSKEQKEKIRKKLEEAEKELKDLQDELDKMEENKESLL